MNKILSISYYILTFISLLTSAASKQDFLQCLTLNQASFSNITYTQNNPSYSSALQITIVNLRFNSTSTRKPLAVIAPLHEHQIPPVISCAQKHGLQIRVRSGGHDYEGISYTSKVPFVVLDMISLRSIDVDVASETTWVQVGATVGELYEGIANKSRTLGFPAGICPTVGVGGQFSGGGYGLMVRKYGLAADNIIDARMIAANGRMLDRISMREDLFWAIRGGGGASFGVILAWKIKLVRVPVTVTAFRVQRTLEQNATQLVHRWQSIASKFHEDMYSSIIVTKVNTSDGVTTIQAQFSSFLLGGVDRLLRLTRESFPELRLAREDCTEMSWIQAMRYFAAGTPTQSAYFKAKSDYVKEPIPVEALQGIWRQFFDEEGNGAALIMVAYGGKMDKISESELPFPHRAGNLYQMQEYIRWGEEEEATSEKYITWMRRLYKYLAPYVSKSPREAYVNYRDFDVGKNNDMGDTSYVGAATWGKRYFKNNFQRLAQVKTVVDPHNFFRNEQSIPLLST